MPSFIAIHRVQIWLDGVLDQEAADHAASQAAALEGEDLHTETTLGEYLAKLTFEVPGATIAVQFRTEERETGTMAYARGKPLDGPLPKGRSGPAAGRGKRKIAPRYAAFLEAEEAARKAIAQDDHGAMLRLLDDARLGEPQSTEARFSAHMSAKRSQTRRDLWRAIVSKKRAHLTLERVLRAFAEEDDDAAHIIAYKLYLQAHLRDALAARANAKTGDERVERRVAHAIREWPDFPREQASAPPVKRTWTLLERLDAVLPRLEEVEEPAGLRNLRRALEAAAGRVELAEARTQAGPHLAPLLAPDKPERVRALAVELLWLLDVSADELLPHVASLPASPVVDAIRRAAERPHREPEVIPEGQQGGLRAIACDVRGIDEPDVAAMALAEARDLGARPYVYQAFGALAEAFPKARFAYVETDGAVHVARNGKRDESGPKPSADAMERDDVRARAKGAPAPEDLPAAYVAFVQQRAALERGYEGDEPPEALWRMLGAPALWATEGPLRRLGESVRIDAYQRLSRPPRSIPVSLAVDLLLRDEHQGFRLRAALRRRRDLAPVFGAALREATSALVRKELREVLGDAAKEYETRAIVTRVPVSTEPVSIEAAVEEALARAEVSTLGAPGPTNPSAAEGLEQREARAIASEACMRGELPGLLAALDHPALAHEDGNKARVELWKVIVETQRRSLSMPRVLRALAEEVEEVVRVIAYKLYVQKHLDALLLEAAVACFARVPRSARLLSRIAYATSEWPDFKVPEAVPRKLAAMLRMGPG